ncbi:TetR family transcriptional regulator [Streptomyces sp. TR1341]|uniref:AcrR family transcriptional regulator n=2 Tax=Streptomyces TaxID=1883 RepID=A0A7W3NJ63_STRMR|nr:MULTISPECIES: TetR family transcriptional regulator [Streptomyces]MYQ98509.1 TetR family transcriptional regulator [Streptomyces sp. SID6139]NDK28486.1 TetR family transcriptional regulator [Streptomyces sp. TR1341]MBA9051498.1 AcrR family transcriptional regulator [Streptomyces murinus]UWW92865.1 TetR family transcriptional regulator [Streptomyces murinus]WSI83497.1 TetR/AcrR family transcriptional regulator [Streptomyces murinus]
MGRWEPNTRERLAKAALDLYGERGFEQTTVAEIAKSAGLTERTFFRHYADKREVLFSGAIELEQLFTRAVAGAPPSAAPIDAMAAGLDAICAVFEERRDFARKRQAVISATAELRERELIKLASLAAALTDTLRGRGVPPSVASLTAETGVAVFKVAFERWIVADETRPLDRLARESLDELRAVALGGNAPMSEV